MYKLLLCWRYLRTRYLALVCIVSVMLGVATLIVVNSVMAGFSTKLKERLHGLLSDVVIETGDHLGFDDVQGKMALIRSDPILGDKVEAMAGVMEIFAVLQFEVNTDRGLRPVVRPVRLIGIDPEERARVGGFREFLVTDLHRREPARVFELDEAGRRHYHNMQRFDSFSWRVDPQPPPVQPAATEPLPELETPPLPLPEPGKLKPPPDPPPLVVHVPRGIVIGYSIGHVRRPDAAPGDADDKEMVFLRTGDEVFLTTISGPKLQPVTDRLVVTDFIKTEMSEYDSNYVYVPLRHLQKLRGMDGRVTSLQIKLKNYADAKIVVKRLRELFGPYGLYVSTWEEKQGPLLAAIEVEKGILNVLLFLIVGVAGFGILAIFSMIVMEKTRDIGILKALGASNAGVMKIFLGYGLLLGLVGAVFGTVLGLIFTDNINAIEKFLAGATGREIFPRDVYYFDKIPTDVQFMSVLLVNCGAVAIAVLFSVLPALRAAMLHPVRALRYE